MCYPASNPMPKNKSLRLKSMRRICGYLVLPFADAFIFLRSRDGCYGLLRVCIGSTRNAVCSGRRKAFGVRGTPKVNA